MRGALSALLPGALRVLAGFVLLAAVVCGVPRPAQADVWSGTLTVQSGVRVPGANGVGCADNDRNARCRENDNLINRTVTYKDDSEIINTLVLESDGDLKLWFGRTLDDSDELRLHIGSNSWDFTSSSRQTWTGTDLSWSSGDTIQLRISSKELPSASDKKVTTTEDTGYTLAATDFGFVAPVNHSSRTLESVKITTLPTAGTLTKDGTAVSADGTISKADLDANKLVFTPAADANGEAYTTFEFKVNDGTNDSAVSYTITIDVTAVNDDPTGAPSISGVAALGVPLTAAPGTIADADGLPDAADFSWQWVRVDATMDPATETTISGATGTTYTPVRADVGKQLKVRATFTDAAGTNEGPLSSAAYPAGGTVESVDLTEAEGDATTLEMDFNKALDTTSVPDISTFSAKRTRDGTTAGVTLGGTPAISGQTVTLTLNDTTALSYRDTDVKVSYTKPNTGNRLRSTENLEVETFTDRQVANKTTRDDPTLSALSLSGGTLTPTFAASTFSYTANVANKVTQTTVTATTTQTAARADYPMDADTGTPGQQVDLDVGDNTIRVTGTAPDGTSTKTYTIVVTRADNTPATGPLTPWVSHVWRVPAVVTAGTSAIRDADGLTSPTYVYQWIRVDGTTETDISGATSRTYTLTADDVGKKLKAKVTFEDDTGDTETLTSAATETIQATATCNAPTFTDEAKLWEGVVYVEYYEDRSVGTPYDSYGFSVIPPGFSSDPNFVVGALSLPRNITVRGKTYRIDHLQMTRSRSETSSRKFSMQFAITLIDPGTGDGLLSLPEPVEKGLALYICDEPLYIRDSSEQLSREIQAVWRYWYPGGAALNALSVENHDWSDNAERTLYLALDNAPPRPTAATVTDTTLVLTFHEKLDSSTPLPSTFTVKRTRGDFPEETVSVSGTPTISGKTVTLTLASTTFSGDTNVKVSYAKPSSGNKLRDPTHNEVVSFTDYPVTNNTTATASTDATLSALSISPGTLTPAFAAATTRYATDVDYFYSESQVTVQNTPNHAGAISAYLDGNDAALPDANTTTPGQQVDLDVGVNTIKIKVTAQDRVTTRTYTITITRLAASMDATLSALSISPGTLTPVFAAATTSYTPVVAHTETQVTVQAAPNHRYAGMVYLAGNNATLTDADDTTPGQQVDLGVGDRIIKIKVTAENPNSTRTYTVTVTRKASPDATLKALSISGGTLTPVFAAATKTYTADVDNEETPVTVEATPTQDTAPPTQDTDVPNPSVARVAYLDESDAPLPDADGTSGQQVDLAVGANEIKIKVTAPDPDFTETYTVTVTRANAPPTAEDSTVTAFRNRPYTFKAADFNFADTDEGQTLASVQIITLPAEDTGHLEVEDPAPDTEAAVLEAGDLPLTITRADLDAGRLKYRPPQDEIGQDLASFTFKVNDGIDESDLDYTMTIHVRPPPPPPPPGVAGGAGGAGAAEEEEAAEPVGYLENPGTASFQSGIGVISGWVCEADEVEVEIGELGRQAAGYGTERLDTEAECEDTDNGFGLLFNWNLLGDGEYAVVAFVDDVELGRTTVTVTTLGVEFLRDVTGACEAEDFPMLDESVTLVWQQSQQNFVIAHGPAPQGAGRAGAIDVGFLENPSPNSFQSGIGVISGWVCEGEKVEVELGHLERQLAAYGTERLDTQDVCGDKDNGFGLLFNWNRLGEGEHEVVAFVDDEELGRATVRVTTVGEGEEEEFLRGVEGECVVEDFPGMEQMVTLEWQQNQQNFVITDVE